MIKTFAKVSGGIVINLALAEDVWPFADNPYIEVPNGLMVSVGWGHTNGQFIDLTPPPAVAAANQPTSTGLQAL